MLFPTEIFKQLNGFDQKFFLYYEDVDLCARLRLLVMKWFMSDSQSSSPGTPEQSSGFQVFEMAH